MGHTVSAVSLSVVIPLQNIDCAVNMIQTTMVAGLGNNVALAPALQPSSRRGRPEVSVSGARQPVLMRRVSSAVKVQGNSTRKINQLLKRDHFLCRAGESEIKVVEAKSEPTGENEVTEEIKDELTEKAVAVEAPAAVDGHAAEKPVEEPSPVQDALAGLTTAFSLLSKAIAVSAMVGVNPLVGIWSSVVMGVTAPLLGSRPGVISGAAAVVVVPLAALTAVHGTAYIAPVILIAAAIEFTFGALRLSKLTSLVSDGVMAGFLNALGLLLLESQFKVFTKAPSMTWAVAMAAVTIAFDRILPKYTKAVPASLVGLVVATGIGIVAGAPLKNLVQMAGAETFRGGLSSLPSLIDIPTLMGQFTSISCLQIVVPCAISISFISILETLLAARVVDNMSGQPLCTFNSKGEIECFPNSKTGEMPKPGALDVPTKSVLGMSVGKTISAFLGGFGGCGLIPQTVLNLNSGGGGALSSASYALSMAAFVLVLAPLVGQISLAALAGIMVTVAFDTMQFGATKDIIVAAFPGSGKPKEKGTRSELIGLLVTFFLCYKVDMAIGIVSGVVVERILRKISGAPPPVSKGAH